jgi:3-hydroxyacyl-CoA dehydrogenase/enoyl-CoA hydratase/3-hydroxybutyryl-CoA epimerase
MAYQFFSIERRADGVALVWIDYPGEKINKASTKVTAEFDDVLVELAADAQVKAVVVISKKADNFIAGADIEEFRAMTAASQALDLSRHSQQTLDRVRNIGKPVVAAIHGLCIGGGLEVALACHYRIATDHPKTQLGAPEVKLGLIPAAAGTQRLPQLIGLQAGLDMLLTGKNVHARKAKKMGLVDEVVAPYGLADQAASVALRLAATVGPAPRRRRPLRERLIEGFGPARRLAFRKAREMVMKQTKGNYPAPLAILECVQTGFEQGIPAGLAKESEMFGPLMVSPESRSLLGLFMAMNERRKLPLAQGTAKPERIAVVGAGLMGAGVALVSVTQAETPTILKDISAAAVAAGEKYVAKDLDKRVAKGRIRGAERDRIFSRLDARADYHGFERANLVIEAVFENLDLKRRVLAEVEALVGDDCVYASNTSALPIAEIAAGARRPENVLGMHYFSPVPSMPLLEIIVAPQTAERAAKVAAAAGVAQGRTIIVVKDGPGFYTTRILVPYLNELGLLLEDGATIEEIDAALTAFGFPIGPALLLDEVGLDVGAHVGEFLGRTIFADRGVRQATGIAKMFAAGFLGRKNKRGFYQYDAPSGPAWKTKLGFRPKKKKLSNPDVYQYFGAERRPPEREVVQLRAALAMVNEAAQCLQDGVIASPTDGDLGAILGLGFPPFRGGPFRFIDTYGAGKLTAKLEEYAAQFGAQFKPAAILVEHAQQEKKFHEK